MCALWERWGNGALLARAVRHTTHVWRHKVDKDVRCPPITNVFQRTSFETRATVALRRSVERSRRTALPWRSRRAGSLPATGPRPRSTSRLNVFW